MSIWHGEFWKAVAERAIKTFCQTAAALLLVIAAGEGGLLDVDWIRVLAVSGLAMVISVLTSVGSNAATKDGPSMVKAEVVEPAIPIRPRPGDRA